LGCVGRVQECLPSKLNDLNLIPSAKKTKQNKTTNHWHWNMVTSNTEHLYVYSLIHCSGVCGDRAYVKGLEYKPCFVLYNLEMGLCLSVPLGIYLPRGVINRPRNLCVCVWCVVLGFERRAYTLSHTTSPFLCWVFLR
jgi:hypothetical protein